MRRGRLRGGWESHAVEAELTPNEYAKAKEFKDTYRLCVVTDALGKCAMRTFTWDQSSKHWTGDNGATLLIEERIGARVRMA